MPLRSHSYYPLSMELTGQARAFQLFKKIELALFLLSAVFFLLKISRVQYPQPIYLMAMASLSIFTFLFAFSNDYIYDIKQPILRTIANVSCSILIMGVLFYSFFWPGGKNLLIVGTINTLAMILWMMAVGQKGFSISHFFNKLLFAKMAFFILIGIWFLFTPQVDLYKQISSNGKDPKAVYLYEQHVNDPHNKEKLDAFNKYVRKK